jgi:hypothetical protein
MTRDDTQKAMGAPDKAYDAVATQRQIREQISHETAGMSLEELQRYLRSHINVPFTPLPHNRSVAA